MNYTKIANHKGSSDVSLDGKVDQDQHGGFRYYLAKIAFTKKCANVH
jgi:hypothetical protein